MPARARRAPLRLACLLILALLLGAAVPAGAGAATTAPHAQSASAVANAFAAAFARQGAGYLVGHLKNGALGEHGATVGNLLGPFVEDGTATDIAAIRREIDGLSLAIVEVHSHLNTVAGHVVQAQYSHAALEAAKITGAIDKAQKELAHLAHATTAHSRRIHAEHLIAQLGPHGELYSAQEILHKQLTVPAPGADGLLIAANKAARGKAHPFFTHQLSLSQREVYKYYSMYEAVLLQLRLNYWHYKGYTSEEIHRELKSFESDLAGQNALVKTWVHEGIVVDTRTGLAWTFGYPGKPIAGTWTSSDHDVWVRPLHGTDRRILQCGQDLCPYGYGGVWMIPTPAELGALLVNTLPNRWTWLHDHAGFPQPVSTAVAWVSPPPHDGVAPVMNLNDTAVYDQPTSAKHHFILVNDAAVQIPNLYWYP
ncbi:MAG TPA: hypothetical protein VGO48_09470 [Conexibacter sp.]|nr:hypothetical protein [Conexibacter sp.]